jgi:hypothetical protein
LAGSSLHEFLYTPESTIALQAAASVPAPQPIAPKGQSAAPGGARAAGTFRTSQQDFGDLIVEPQSSYLWLYISVGFILLCAGAVSSVAYWRYRKRPAPVPERDTKEFAEALDHWAPAVFQARPSPREMKRFLNRIRYCATALIQRLDGSTLASFANLRLDAPALVTLGALAHYDRSLVLGLAEFNVSPLYDLTTRVSSSRPENANNPDRRLAALVRDTLEEFDRRFTQSKLSQEAAAAFLSLWTDVRVR